MMRDNFADGVHVEENPVGMPRWYARCDVHPTWRPGPGSRDNAVRDAASHSRQWHDGIDYDGMPDELAAALRDVRDVEVRRRIATASRTWADRAVMARPPESPYFQCYYCTYGTYGSVDFQRHALATGHVLDIAKEG